MLQHCQALINEPSNANKISLPHKLLHRSTPPQISSQPVHPVLAVRRCAFKQRASW